MSNLIIKIFYLTIFTISTNIAFAQTKEQREKIKAETNIEQLKALKEQNAKKKLSKKQLQDLAKKKNIPYRKETNGTVYELQGFDKNDKPIYYITNGKSSELKKEECSHTCCQAKEEKKTVNN